MLRAIILSALFAASLAFPASADFQNLGAPYPITWTRFSSTITTGGTSQQLLPANPGRKALFIENPCNATEDLYVDFGQAASSTVSIDIAACSNLSLGIGIVSQQQVTIVAATTGHAFIAYEGQ